MSLSSPSSSQLFQSLPTALIMSFSFHYSLKLCVSMNSRLYYYEYVFSVCHTLCMLSECSPTLAFLPILFPTLRIHSVYLSIYYIYTLRIRHVHLLYTTLVLETGLPLETKLHCCSSDEASHTRLWVVGLRTLNSLPAQVSFHDICYWFSGLLAGGLQYLYYLLVCWRCFGPRRFTSYCILGNFWSMAILDSLPTFSYLPSHFLTFPPTFLSSFPLPIRTNQPSHSTTIVHLVPSSGGVSVLLSWALLSHLHQKLSHFVLTYDLSRRSFTLTRPCSPSHANLCASHPNFSPYRISFLSQPSL